MSSVAHLQRYVHTLRHLKPQQVTGRLAARVRRRLGVPRLPEPPRELRGALHPHVALPHHDPWNTREGLLAGRFRFVGETRDLGDPVDWSAPGASALWQFNLHYFNYLHRLESSEQEALCRAWWHHVPEQAEPGWHPYPTALRIINWCKAGIRAPDLMDSLYRQATYLYRHLETYLLGNHLLENARALVYAGHFFDGQGEAPQWLARGLDLYRRQTPEQILPDGGHVERSPMYHALMLEGYLDVINLLPRDHPDQSWLTEAAQRMVDFLVAMTHPEGQIALFNDAAHEIALPTRDLLDYAQRLLGYEPAGREAFPNTGYFIARTPDLYLAIDGGAVGPDYLPAHAHADIFSFELSVGGQVFIVDSGTSTYQAGTQRAYERSTAAHNTVEVDGTDQVECWGAFRVARRAAPSPVTFESHATGARFQGTFDGYDQLLGGGIRHHRTIEVFPDKALVRIEDRVEGRGTHQVRSRLHLHPDVTVEEHAHRFVLERGGWRCTVLPEGVKGRIETGWYSPHFGKPSPTQVLLFEATVPLPHTFGCCLTYGPVEGDA